MKLRTFLILMTTLAALTNAHRSAAGEHTAPESIANQQLAYVAPSDISYLSMQAKASRITFSDDPNLFSGTTISDRTDAGLIENWRERVFASLRGTTLSQRGQETNIAGKQTAEMRMVARIAMKETMKLALERMPEIDRLVKSLKLEVSTDMISREDEDLETEATPSIAPPSARNSSAKSRFFMKTGLRIPVDNNKPALLSETDAVYGNFTSFVNVRINSRLDSTMGIRYTLNAFARLQVERQETHTTDTAAGCRTISNLVKVVCAF